MLVAGGCFTCYLWTGGARPIKGISLTPRPAHWIRNLDQYLFIRDRFFRPEIRNIVVELDDIPHPFTITNSFWQGRCLEIRDTRKNGWAVEQWQRRHNVADWTPFEVEVIIPYTRFGVINPP